MATIVFIILQIFFATRAFKIGEYLTTIHRSGGKYPTLATDSMEMHHKQLFLAMISSLGTDVDRYEYKLGGK